MSLKNTFYIKGFIANNNFYKIGHGTRYEGNGIAITQDCHLIPTYQ
jgi:hypothetical protein